MSIVNENTNKYNAWQSVTGADYVSMFIKTWFAYISTLIEMFPKPSTVTKKGDQWHLSEYSKFFKEKGWQKIPVNDNLKNNLYEVYKNGREIVATSFKEYYFINFYSTTENDVKFESKNSKNGYSMCLKVHEDYDKKTLNLKGKLNYWSYHKCKFNDSIKIDINLKSIIKNISNDMDNTYPIDEITYMSNLYSEIQKEFIKQVSEKMRIKSNDNTAERLIDKTHKEVQGLFEEAMQLSAKSYLNMTPKELSNVNNIRIIRQLPIENFISERERLTQIRSTNDIKPRIPKKDKEKFDLIQKLTVNVNRDSLIWFLNFVYLLRNALFHEIIDPFDEKWQIVFKSAFLVLTELVDMNIKHIETLETKKHCD